MKKSTKQIAIFICAFSLVLTLVGTSIGLGFFGSPTTSEDIPSTDLASTYKGEIKDSDGNLLVPFDVAYPEAFASGNYAYDKDVLLLKLKEGFGNKINKALTNCGFASIEKFIDTDSGDWYRAMLSDGVDILTAIQKARSLSEVLIADFNYTYQTEAIDYDNVVLSSVDAGTDSNGNPFDCDDAVKENHHWKDQYNLGKNKVQEAWKFLKDHNIIAGGSSSVIVAVIDTGVDYNHPDLKANIWVNKNEVPGNGIDDDSNGYVDDVYGCSTIGSTYNHNGNPMDDHGHGTHVAGIIAASNNKEGVVGIAYNVKIMPIKAGQATGVFTQADIAEAILYAYQMGADVINMSFGGGACSIAVQDALTTAYTSSILVASAGNDGAPNEGMMALPNYPAALSYVIGVMSVDRNGVESGFTNYDVKAYNSVEYEVYAPGEQIISTLPDGRYGKLSGTSMAAPTVSAAAALLRSYYSDRNMYPSKFIAAQICATSQDEARCCDPDTHGPHNLPMMLNIIDAFTKLPKPDVQVFDYYVFDPTSYNGVEYENNNGDGVADAGETLLIGLVLRNRWGMSKDTLVTVDALSSGGVANPHVEIIDGEVNFESVATYSTKSTLVYNEENIIIGITDPIIIKLSEDCPNDYLIGINVYLSYKNALDEKDNTQYRGGEAGNYEVQFWARNGYILPSQITEDMTLTKDNYYIIPNSTYIYEGVTVTVEPGTQIQFWSDDPSDPYADTYIAYLNVAGSFICHGTEEEAVQLFPSEMMSNYVVQIKQASTDALVDLNYTKVTNPVIVADYIDHCTFNYNYNNAYLRYRYLSEGRVKSSETCGLVSAIKAENCLFYKCGCSYALNLHGEFVGCAFVDSKIDFKTDESYSNICGTGLYGSISSYKDCVFMGNNTGSYTSSMVLNNPLSTGVEKVVRDSNTGTSYIVIDYNSDGSGDVLDMVRRIAQAFGGDIACFETKAEWDFINRYISSYYTYGIGIDSRFDSTWVNGEPIGDFIPLDTASGTGTGFYYDKYVVRFDTYSSGYIIEIPGSIYVDNISLREDDVKIDNESSYQIFASTIPSTFDISGLIYVSEDENIATVSEGGLVTPVGEGETRIFVYSPDYMVYDVLNIQVIDKVSLSDVSFENTSLTIEEGKSVELIPIYSPVNTTERTITYLSSDPEIASVNQYGIITANKNGTVTITATAHNGTTDEITVRVISLIEDISFGSNIYGTTLDDTDESWKPVVTPMDASDYVIKYESSNPEVAYVDENGELVRVGEGFTRIAATVVGTDLYDEIEVIVSESILASPNIVCMDDGSVWLTINNLSDWYYMQLAVTEDGSLYVWGDLIRVPIKIADGVKSAVFGRMTSSFNDSYSANYVSYVNEAGELKALYLNWRDNGVSASNYSISSTYQLTNLAGIYEYSHSYYALTNEGTLWVLGNNECGQLGVGSTTALDAPALCGISDVKEIIPYYNTVAILQNNGDLYVAGTYNNKYLIPTKVDSGVADIRGGNYSVIYDKQDGSQYYLDRYYASPDAISGSYGKVQFCIGDNDHFYSSDAVYVKDGKLYYRGTEVKGVSNPEKLFYYKSAYYMVTEKGELYAFGDNNYYQLADLTKNHRYDRAEKVYFGINLDDSAPKYSGSNVVDEYLYDETIIVDFDHAIRSGSKFGYVTLKNSAGTQLAMLKDVRLDKLTLTPAIPLVSGESYIVTIPAGAFISAFGGESEAATLTFTYLDDRSIEFIDSSITDGVVLDDGAFDASIEFTYAIAGDSFDSISLTLNGVEVDGLTVELNNSILNLSAEGLLPGEYLLTIPAGALKDNIGGTSSEMVYNLVVPSPEEEVYVPLAVVYSSIGSRDAMAALYPQWRVEMNKEFTLDNSLVTLIDAEGNAVEIELVVEDNTLVISALQPLSQGTAYTITVSEGAMTDEAGATVDTLEAEFTTLQHGERFFWTVEGFAQEYRAEVYNNPLNYRFYGNAILNNFNITDVEKWLRVTAASGSVNEKIGLAGNWWGTTIEEMIGRQIIDFDDYQSLMDIVYAPYLTEAPSNTFPFVTAVYLINSSGEVVNKVGNETVTIVIEFNRDMDTSIPLRVRFGSSVPYAEYEIEGAYVDARRWEGTYTLKTTIENGRQFFRIENGAAADDGYLGLYETPGRFGFELDTTAAQALTMFGEATETGIKLTWTQDDFDTLAGYNVYRSTREDGNYVRLNSYVLPVDVKEFFDDTVEPGQRYYYNFTVVKTDLTESIPSGKINIMSMDTMAPDIYHSPVRTAYTGSNLIINATVTDNLGIDEVILYYRTVGSTEWNSTEMTALNSRYTGLISSDHISLEGIEYYIEARDGRNSTYKGSAENPYEVIVKLAVDANSLGDVDGDGVITNRDALMLLQAANDLLNLTEEQFMRADINEDGELSAAEALRILQYVSGKVTTIVD